MSPSTLVPASEYLAACYRPDREYITWLSGPAGTAGTSEADSLSGA
jgi:hypothetical protein